MSPFLARCTHVEVSFNIANTINCSHSLTCYSIQIKTFLHVYNIILNFCAGALTPMPAVKIFSLYAALAVLFDFFLQMSLFVALLTLDAKREMV